MTQCVNVPSLLDNTPMLVHAVVPIKPIAFGKRRLAQALSPRERQLLIVAMLGHVIDVLHGTQRVAGVHVLTSDPGLVPDTCEHMNETSTGLNVALSMTAEILERQNVKRLLILPADLPYLRTEDLDALFDAARNHSVVIAPDASESGTNALLLTPPTLMMPLFGPSSFEAHLRAARSSGHSLSVIHHPGLQKDIDNPEDLDRLRRHPPAVRFAFLSRGMFEAS